MATNTVPIEIVLQDPNNPIVPDTPGDDPGENTNISVPDTALGTGGYTTKDGSSTGNIFTGSNATVSIVSIVVLVLALGAIVTLLVRRYQKHKKNAESKEAEAKASKGERLATAATGTLAVLAATVLVGQLLMTTTNAATSEGTALSTPDKIQIIANRYEDVTIVASTKAISYATTDTSFGYKIFMSMAGEDANLYLDGDTGSQYYFAPTTKIGLGTNSWGYSFNSDGEDGYLAMPLADDAIMAQQKTSAVSDDEFTVYYTMKADKDMPFGIYSGEVAYNIVGQSGFPDTLTTMQGMTSEICDATYTPNAFKDDGVTIENNVPTATLTDIRDNKTYTVAKLADGKCWMTKNLDLQKEDLLAGVTLDSTNTDNPADGFELPDSQTSGSSYWGDGEENYNTAHIYDISNDGNEYHYCKKYDRYAGCTEYSDNVIPSEKLHNFYNWYAATAGTGTFSMVSDETANGSICPAGWKLPGISTDEASSQTDMLMQVYGITKEGAAKLLESPFLFVLGGYYGYGVSGVDVTEVIGTSVAYNNSTSRVFEIDYGSGTVVPWTSSNKNYGYGVRCLAR